MRITVHYPFAHRKCLVCEIRRKANWKMIKMAIYSKSKLFFRVELLSYLLSEGLPADDPPLLNHSFLLATRDAWVRLFHTHKLPKAMHSQRAMRSFARRRDDLRVSPSPTVLSTQQMPKKMFGDSYLLTNAKWGIATIIIEIVSCYYL